MTAKGKWLAAGGSQQQLVVFDMETFNTSSDVLLPREHFNGPVGGTVNNALHIGAVKQGEELLFVCNNDDTVKIYDVNSMQVHSRIRFEVAINYCSLCPDGTYLACVGDRPEVYLYKAVESGFQKQGTMIEGQDAGMCCSWSPGGNMLGAAFQCGAVAVWDIRSNKAICKLKCDQPIRSMKFSSGPMDLLAFSEHDSYVNVMDARCVDKAHVQRLQIPQLPYNTGQRDGRDGRDISGIAFTPDGTRLYVGQREGIERFDVDTFQRRGFPVATKI